MNKVVCFKGKILDLTCKKLDDILNRFELEIKDYGNDGVLIKSNNYDLEYDGNVILKSPTTREILLKIVDALDSVLFCDGEGNVLLKISCYDEDYDIYSILDSWNLEESESGD